MSSTSLRSRTVQVLAVSAFLSAAGSARANVVTLAPSKDNTIYAESGSLSNALGVNMFAGLNGTLIARRALLHFDIAGNIPAGSVINSVTLQVRCNQSSGGSGARTHTLYRVTTDWGESTSDAGDPGGGGAAAATGDATWIHGFYNTSSWGSAGGDFIAAASSSVVVNAVGTYTFPSSAGLATDVQGWLATPAGNFGWIMIGDESGGVATAKRFATRENSVAADRPVLTVDFTPPIPAMPRWGIAAMAAVLAVTGAVCVARPGRRTQS